MFRQPQEMIEDRLIVRHLSGSRAYGTQNENSDTDIRGIFAADDDYITSPWHNVKELDITDEEDTKYYELSNFMKLLVDQNPNIVESLWVDRSHVMEISPAYIFLRSERYNLLSSKVAFTYSGYAMSQLKRIKGHNKWINSPQSEDPPRQVDNLTLVYNFLPDKLLKMTGNIFLTHFNINTALKAYGDNTYGLYHRTGRTSIDGSGAIIKSDIEPETVETPIMIVKFNAELYKQKKELWKNYWSWKKNRNSSRSELEELHGYDTKHAMHLIRLLRTAEEILVDGEVKVKRPDASELLDIRNGCMGYDELLKYATDMNNNIQTNLYESTWLPKSVDLNYAHRILMKTRELIN